MMHSFTRCCRCVPCGAPACAWYAVVQIKCNECGKWTDAAGSDRHHLCRECKHARYYGSLPPLPPSPPPSSSPPPSLFGRPIGCIDQLTLVERAAIVTLHKVGWIGCDIAQAIHCNKDTVSLWVNRWRDEHSVADAERSGRPRCATDDTITYLHNKGVTLVEWPSWSPVFRFLFFVLPSHFFLAIITRSWFMISTVYFT